MLKANQLTTYTKTENDASLLLKANQLTTYTKTENDTALNLKVTKTDLATNLTTLTAKIGTGVTTIATLSIRGDSVTETLIVASTKGTGTCKFGVGNNGDQYIQSFASAGFVSIGETSTSKVMIGTISSVTGYPFVVGSASFF